MDIGTLSHWQSYQIPVMIQIACQLPLISYHLMADLPMVAPISCLIFSSESLIYFCHMPYAFLVSYLILWSLVYSLFLAYHPCTISKPSLLPQSSSGFDASPLVCTVQYYYFFKTGLIVSPVLLYWRRLRVVGARKIDYSEWKENHLRPLIYIIISIDFLVIQMEARDPFLPGA